MWVRCAAQAAVAVAVLLLAPLAGAQLVELDRAQPTPSPVTAGQMSERAAAAKRLFDQERWSEAARALHAVARGETADDAGNRQIAEYHEAVALYRLGLHGAAAALFTRIARSRWHLKRNETLLWLAKLITGQPARASQLCPILLESYDETRAVCFWHEQQADLHSELMLQCGAVEYEAGRYPRALRLLSRVSAASKVYVRAQLLSAGALIELGVAARAEAHLRRALVASNSEPVRREVRRLRRAAAAPRSAWRNPALKYWQARGFRHRPKSR